MRITKSLRSQKPLLRREHFHALATQLTETGVSFSSWIGPEDREWMLVDVEEIDPRFAERPPRKVVVNPRRPSLKALEAYLRQQQRHQSLGEHINVGYRLEGHERKRRVYDRTWAVEADSDEMCEGQDLVAVAFALDPMQPLGYFSIEVEVALDCEECRADVRIEP